MTRMRNSSWQLTDGALHPPGGYRTRGPQDRAKTPPTVGCRAAAGAENLFDSVRLHARSAG